MVAVSSLLFVAFSMQLNVSAQTVVKYKGNDREFKTEKPVYVQVTHVKPCCIDLVTETLKATSGVKFAKYDSEKDLYIITPGKNFKLQEAQQNVLNKGKGHDNELNKKERIEWILSTANASSSVTDVQGEKICGKGCKGEGKGCCSKP